MTTAIETPGMDTLVLSSDKRDLLDEGRLGTHFVTKGEKSTGKLLTFAKEKIEKLSEEIFSNLTLYAMAALVLTFTFIYTVRSLDPIEGFRLGASYTTITVLPIALFCQIVQGIWDSTFSSQSATS